MDQSVLSFIFELAILVMSVVIHEVSHGVAAYTMGDSTAKYAGRLTLNPIPHVDPFGSIFLPFILSLVGGPVFGWAKPVPYNPYNLRNQRWGPGIVAAAGPISNLLMALIFGLIGMLLPISRIAKSEIWGSFVYGFLNGEQNLASLAGQPLESFYAISLLVVFINIVLAIFNLVPIPPLDGSKVLFSFLSYRYNHIQAFLEQYGFVLLVIFIVFFFQLLYPAIFFIFRLFTG